MPEYEPPTGAPFSPNPAPPAAPVVPDQQQIWPPALSGQPPRTRAAIQRRWWLIGGIAAALVVVLGAAAVVFMVRWISDSPTSALSGAADRIRSAPAIRTGVAYRDAGGHTITGQFTVTSDNLVSGTVTDPQGGRADLVAGAGTSAVRGDADWWARRSPKQVHAISNQWVRPEPGVAFPFDVAAVLNPTALARRVEALAGAARRDDQATGERVDDQVHTVVSGDWTALFDTSGSRKPRWMGGPLDPSLVIQPAVYHDDGDRADGIVPAVRIGPTTPAGSAEVVPARYDPIAIPPYVAITPEPIGSDAATGTQVTVAKVLPRPVRRLHPEQLPPRRHRGRPPNGTSSPATPSSTWCRAPRTASPRCAVGRYAAGEPGARPVRREQRRSTRPTGHRQRARSLLLAEGRI